MKYVFIPLKYSNDKADKGYQASELHNRLDLVLK